MHAMIVNTRGMSDMNQLKIVRFVVSAWEYEFTGVEWREWSIGLDYWSTSSIPIN